MIIYNTTKFDGAEIKKSILADNKYKLIKQLIIFGVLFILGSILLVLGLLYETTETVFTMGIGLVIFSILYFLFSLLKTLKERKNVDKNFEYEINNTLIYEYTFREEKFILNIKMGDRTSKLELFYNSLKRIVNTSDQIIFVVSNMDAYKCKKDGFKTKKEEELFFFGLKKHNIKIKDKTNKS